MSFFRLASLLVILGASPGFAYQNPLLPHINDPDCYQEGGLYRLIEPEGNAKTGYFNYRTSKDLVHWSDPVRILPQAPGFVLWQGSFFRDTDGQLYLYSAVNQKGVGKTVHVAKAADFTGPFQDLGVVAADDAIDPYPLRAQDGSLWLYYKNDMKGQKGIWAQKMKDPATPDGAPIEVLHPRPGTFEDNGYLTVEGPTVIYRAGLYFLIYTGGPYDAKSYAVGYAVSKNPDGPFVRGPNNPILSNAASPDVFSPGVPTVVQDGAGKSWLVYRQRQTGERRSPRTLTIDPLDDSRAAQGILSATATSGTEEPDPVPLP